MARLPERLTLETSPAAKRLPCDRVVCPCGNGSLGSNAVRSLRTLPLPSLFTLTRLSAKRRLYPRDEMSPRHVACNQLQTSDTELCHLQKVCNCVSSSAAIGLVLPSTHKTTGRREYFYRFSWSNEARETLNQSVAIIHNVASDCTSDG